MKENSIEVKKDEYTELLEIKNLASEFINRKTEQFSVGEFRNKLKELEKTIDLNNEEEIALNNRIIDLETKIEKKDKIIDKMAEWIEEHTKYYDEDGCYCEVEEDICDKDIQCKKCIKQYFENKVESEENK